MPGLDPLISIGKVAKRTGCAVSAIRFYADESLIPSVRSAAGHRLFHRSTIRRISFILILQNLGYSLQEIRQHLQALPAGRVPSKRDWNKISRQISADLDEQICRLQKMQTILGGCIGCGCLSLKVCELYNPSDKLGKQGPGARFVFGNETSPTRT